MINRRAPVQDRKWRTWRAGRGVIAMLAVAVLAVPAMVSGSTADAAPSQSAVTAAVTVSSSALFDVACPSATMCFAVGATADPNTALIERWNGTGWSVVQGPNSVSPVGGGLSGIACQNVASCFAVGGALVERWNGIRWSVVPGARLLPGWSGSLSGVSCTSTFCLAVGSQSSSGSTFTLVERWNGSTWSRIHSPYVFFATSPRLTNVWCRGTLCFAVGEFSDSIRIKTLIEQWDGTNMSVLASPNPAAGDTHLHGVACPATTNCVAVGYTLVDGDFGGIPIRTASTWVERWNGTSWSNEAAPNGGGIVSTLMGVTCPGGGCIAVGEYYPSGTLTTWVPFVERWNGTAWSVSSSPHDLYSSLNAVKCPSPTNCFAVGSGSNLTAPSNTAMIARWNGTSWTVLVNDNP